MFPHARIVRVQAEPARDLPGAHAVLTGDDLQNDARVDNDKNDAPAIEAEYEPLNKIKIICRSG